MQQQANVTGNWNGVKVFSCTMAKERDLLGEKVTEWLRANPALELVETVVRQSSDSEFHCLSITVFYKSPKK